MNRKALRHFGWLALVLAWPVFAQNTVMIEERTQVALLRGSSTVAQHPSWEACLEDARRRARAETQTSGTRTFSCQTERRQVIGSYAAQPQPTPVDCRVSDWVQGPLVPATCPASARQTRTDSRTIITQPANGGAVCPSLTQTVSLTCTPPPLPPDPPLPPTGVPYDLTGVEVQFPITWPNAPNTSSVINVSTIAQFQAALRQSRVRVVVAPGTYNGNVTIAGSDVDVAMSNAATLNGSITMDQVRRIRWNGGNVDNNGAGMVWRAVDDLLVNDLYMDGAFELHRVSGGAGVRRFALLNSTIDARSNPNTQFTIYSHPPDGSVMHEDITIANAKLWNTTNCSTRLQKIARLAFISSASNVALDTLDGCGVRIGIGSIDVFVGGSDAKRMLYVGLPMANYTESSPYAFARSKWDRIDFYTAEDAPQAFRQLSVPNTGTVSNMNVYGTTSIGAAVIGISPLVAGPNISRVLPWDGRTLPDISRYGAQR